MPMYDYRCLACGYEAEIEQRITEPALTTCTSCGQESLQRVISAAGGFVLKGTGFYNTDYKNNNRAKSDSKKSAETSTEKSAAPATSTAS
jgi:putative FmdB family regulatory protein